MIKSVFKYIIFLTFAFHAPNTFSITQKIESSPQKAENCGTLICVRNNIDTINEKIVELLATRMEYVYQAGQIKTKNKINSAMDQKRVDAVFTQVEALAKKYNLPKEYVRKIFTIILNDSIKLEQEKMDVTH